MSLAAILILSLWQGALVAPSPSPSPAPEGKDDGDAATIFTEDGSEVSWDRAPDRAGHFKLKKAGTNAVSMGWKKGDEVIGDGSPPWRSDVHEALAALKASGSGGVKRDGAVVDLPYFFASEDQIESSPHWLRPLTKASPVYVADDKDTFDLVKRARGRILVLNFWASWCGPCVSEMPVMDRLSKTYSGRGVYFVGLNMDDKEADVVGFLKKTPVSYPTVRVGNMRRETGKSWGVEGIPFTVIVGKDGRIALVGLGFRGERHEKWLAEALDTLLKPDATPVYLIHKPSR